MDKLDQLREITRNALGDEKGCEWVKSKSMRDIGTYTLEETYELIDALENKDSQAVRDELADLAFHLVLYAEMADKQGDFSWEDILTTAIEKQRHRRLSLEQPAASAEEAHRHWKSQKYKVSKEKGILSDLPKEMPALLRSKKIQDRVGDVGFDWDNVDQIINKLKEEQEEFEVEHKKKDQAAMLDELGDILFTVVNIGRHLNIDAEQALRHANEKFIHRFQKVEKQVAQKGQVIESMSFEALLEVWERVKKSEKHNKKQ